MEFLDENHKKFWKEKNIILERYNRKDVYYKSLIYTLGICEQTRENFNKIFDIKNGEINIDSLHESWQTNTSQKVTRVAFSLWNGCNYESQQDAEKGKISNNYNISDIFCCGYAPYFYEAIKIRYPEYSKEKQINVAMYARVGNIEQLEYYIDKKIKNPKQKDIVALYMRTNIEKNTEDNDDFNYQKKTLEEYCKKNNIENTIQYIDFRKSGLSEDRKALKMLKEDLKIGVVNKVVVTDFSKLYRNQMNMVALLSNDYMEKVDILSVNGKVRNKAYYESILSTIVDGIEENVEKTLNNLYKNMLVEKRKKAMEIRKKNKMQER